jgi:hypothetical protein
MRHPNKATARRNRLSLTFSFKVFGMTIALQFLKLNELFIEIVISYCPGSNGAIRGGNRAKALPSMKWSRFFSFREGVGVYIVVRPRNR